MYLVLRFRSVAKDKSNASNVALECSLKNNYSVTTLGIIHMYGILVCYLCFSGNGDLYCLVFIYLSLRALYHHKIFFGWIIETWSIGALSSMWLWKPFNFNLSKGCPLSSLLRGDSGNKCFQLPKGYSLDVSEWETKSGRGVESPPVFFQAGISSRLARTHQVAKMKTLVRSPVSRKMPLWFYRISVHPF